MRRLIWTGVIASALVIVGVWASNPTADVNKVPMPAGPMTKLNTQWIHIVEATGRTQYFVVIAERKVRQQDVQGVFGRIIDSNLLSHSTEVFAIKGMSPLQRVAVRDNGLYVEAMLAPWQ